jgi:hypothetical protein
VVEDEHGEVARLMICNLEDNMNDPILIEGSIVAIRQPCWSRLTEGGYQIRVDHPSDFVLIETESANIPDAWRLPKATDTANDATQWKKEGDMFFLQKRFRKALEW